MNTRRSALLSIGGMVFAPAALRAGGHGLAMDEAEGPMREIVELDRAWARAVAQRDAEEVKRFIDSAFLATDSTGHHWPHGAYLAGVASTVSGLISIETDEYQVRRFGDVAVVTGRLIYQTEPRRADLAGVFRFTKMFVKRDGQWRCVALHEGRVVG